MRKHVHAKKIAFFQLHAVFIVNKNDAGDEVSCVYV